MRVLVTGSKGQLGSEIKALNPAHEMFYTDLDELDLADPVAIERFIQDHQIEAIINCAAYTAVDKAEKDPKTADQINHLAVAQLAQLAVKYHAFLLHVSTDYVFAGQSARPYQETDPTHPLSVYGKTKLAGEEAIYASKAQAVIVRTAWLYSSYGQNFVKTIGKLALEKPQLTVVDDQIGNPTYARDLAQALLVILDAPPPQGVEIYHYSNEGVASWYDFAQAIKQGLQAPCEILPVDSSAFARPAPRPSYSVFNKGKIKKAYSITIPYWRDSLLECLKKLNP